MISILHSMLLTLRDCCRGRAALHRDRDGTYGDMFRETARWMGIREVLTAPQSPSPLVPEPGS